MSRLNYNYTDSSKNSQKVSIPTTGFTFICSASATQPEGDCSNHGTLDYSHIDESVIDIDYNSDAPNVITLSAKATQDNIDDAGYFTWTSHGITSGGDTYSLRINLSVNKNADVEDVTIIDLDSFDLSSGSVNYCYGDDLVLTITCLYSKNGNTILSSNYPEISAYISYNGGQQIKGQQGTGVGRNTITFNLSGINYFVGETREVTLYASIIDSIGATITDEKTFNISVWDWESGYITMDDVELK